MSNSFAISNHSLQELTDYEILFVSGGMEQQEQVNQNAGGVSGLVYAAFTSGLISGISAGVVASYMGVSPSIASMGGFIGGGLAGGLKHLGSGK